MNSHANDYLISLLNELKAIPQESEWVEFKINNSNPEEIGEYISALSNSAALNLKARGYMVWGIDDITHEVIGTDFNPKIQKVGNEELESWLLRLLSPRLHFAFHNFSIDDKNLCILEIERATHKPIQFKNIEYIRIGSYKKSLKDYSEKERNLWRIFDNIPIEKSIALERQSSEKVLELLNYSAYFELMEQSLPGSPDFILEILEKEQVITRCDAGGWNITNLGALLFANRLDSFPSLSRKAVRVIKYDDDSRNKTLKDTIGIKGYACGFQALINHVNGLVPANEIIGNALRKTLPMFPELAVRELIANALIHQELSMTGTGPMVEIFSNRMEITNPGIPLVDIQRLIDSPPRSRNEQLAFLMRRLGVCEERGSGWDKVVHQTEYYQLPAPIVETFESHTRVVLFSHKPLTEMDKAERLHATYLHACLRYVRREKLTNASLRERFGVEEHNKAAVSRYISQAVEAGLIKEFDKEAARNQKKYVPFWASSL